MDNQEIRALIDELLEMHMDTDVRLFNKAAKALSLLLDVKVAAESHKTPRGSWIIANHRNQNKNSLFVALKAVEDA